MPPTITYLSNMSEKLKNVEYYVIDEISMVGAEMLFHLHLVLQKIHNNVLLLGGKHIICLGDFMQLNPVGTTCIFEKPNYNEKEKITNGYSVWLEISKNVIVLKEQIRAKGDQEFQKILKSARNHFVDKDEIMILKKRIVNVKKLDQFEKIDWVEAPIIVTRNEYREELNLLKLSYYCKEKCLTEILISAKDHFDGDHILNREIFEKIKRSRHKDYLNFPRVIHIALKCTVVLTKNINVEIGLTNGCVGVILDIWIKRETKLHCSNSAQNRRYLTEPPIIIFQPNKINEKLKKYKFKGLELYPEGCVPIVPINTYFNIRWNEKGISKLLKVTRLQLPLNLGYAFTDYKVQGKTLDQAIIDFSIPNSDEGTLDKNSPYMMLSRVKKLNSIVILRDFKDNLFNSKIQKNLKDEIERELKNDISNK